MRAYAVSLAVVSVDLVCPNGYNGIRFSVGVIPVEKLDGNSSISRTTSPSS